MTSYYRWIRGSGSSWKRVAGIELAFDLPPLSWIRLPAISGSIGLGRSLDEPFEDKSRFTFALRYDP